MRSSRKNSTIDVPQSSGKSVGHDGPDDENDNDQAIDDTFDDGDADDEHNNNDIDDEEDEELGDGNGLPVLLPHISILPFPPTILKIAHFHLLTIPPIAREDLHKLLHPLKCHSPTEFLCPISPWHCHGNEFQDSDTRHGHWRRDAD